MEQGLYAQVFMICQEDYDNKKEKETTRKYNSEGKSAISILWLGLDHESLKENFKTRETGFYIKTLSNKY